MPNFQGNPIFTHFLRGYIQFIVVDVSRCAKWGYSHDSGSITSPNTVSPVCKPFFTAQITGINEYERVIAGSFNRNSAHLLSNQGSCVELSSDAFPAPSLIGSHPFFLIARTSPFIAHSPASFVSHSGFRLSLYFLKAVRHLGKKKREWPLLPCLCGATQSICMAKVILVCGTVESLKCKKTDYIPALRAQ